MNKDKKRLDNFREQGTLNLAKYHWQRRVKNGDWSIMVDEWNWDEFEKQKEEYNKKNKGKVVDLSNMAKREVEIRLSKNYQVGAVNVREIDTQDEFEIERDWALAEARKIWSELPSEETKSNSTNKHKPKDYTNKYAKKTNNTAKVTVDDLRDGEGSDKQKEYLAQGINKGLYTLEEYLNADYNTVKDMVGQFFKS